MVNSKIHQHFSNISRNKISENQKVTDRYLHFVFRIKQWKFCIDSTNYNNRQKSLEKVFFGSIKLLLLNKNSTLKRQKNWYFESCYTNRQKDLTKNGTEVTLECLQDSALDLVLLLAQELFRRRLKQIRVLHNFDLNKKINKWFVKNDWKPND